ncbi:nucleoside diphosphate kinase regulator [Nitratireductor basaltis]|uniref:GreA/GreB family elongation factor n=1 Tax=Nitratireductor basaltis TaxID=472175 RepID=A0A084U905_9HYPH|nr:nucleoside diphosphate kinase regulator [Nitratireductor basaltis]KFB09441.1 GreA/GreB family elongation factor [Nitratireductor basaltis]
MDNKTQTLRKPRITIAQSDHDRLLALAEKLEERDPAVSETLFTELERARVVEDDRLPPKAVRMGSRLTYSADDGEPKTVTLVFPAEADIEAGRISITTPVGTALIGLSVGQSINWKARNGQLHKLTVLSLEKD